MLVYIVRFVFILIGAVGAAQLAQQLRLPAPFVGRTYEVLAIIVCVVIGSGVGYVLGGVIGRRLARTLDWIEGSIAKISGGDIAITVSGLIIGLVVATLVSLPIWRTPIVGAYLGLVVYAVLGYLGAWLAYKKRQDFPRIGRQQHFGLGGENRSEAVEAAILDTSVIIDGRIADIAKTGFISGGLAVPRFILRELQTIADSEDPLKRNRGRRGLDVLNALQREGNIEVDVIDLDYPDVAEADGKLVRVAKDTGGALLTNDYNLNKIAELQGVVVMNINELANALKPVALPGEEMSVHVVREGKESGQGVGYLDDGTMVVVDGGKYHIGEDIEVMVTSVLQTPAGRMIFTKLEEVPTAGK